jgi:hypothetical protein
MRCDDIRTRVAEGAPFDDEARGHLATCAACGEEFPELRELTSVHLAAPDALRDRVLASAFPARRGFRWEEFIRMAAVVVIGIGVGFVSGFSVKSAKEVIVKVPSEPIVVDRPVDKPVPDDYVSNVGIAADLIYGEKRKGDEHLVEVTFVPNSVQIKSIVVDPKMRDIEKYCPVARQLGSLAQKRPDVVVYKKKDY